MPNWTRLCKVDPQPFIDWLAVEPRPWQDNPNGIARIWDLPRDLLQPILDRAFRCLKGKVKEHQPCLNKIEPGFVHTMHADAQNSSFWITRIHVPLVTNPDAW